MPSKPRIVFDTNSLISAAILPNSVSRKALICALKHYKLIVSDDTWQEFTSRIEKPSLDHYFPSQESRQDFLLFVSRATEHIVVTSTVTDCVDPNDNMFLALALDGQASILVSGDEDLKKLDGWKNVRVLSTGNFYRECAGIPDVE